MRLNDSFFQRNTGWYRCPNPLSLKPRVTLGFNKVELLGKLGFQMSKDSDTVYAVNPLTIIQEV
jgi:hypothetical protein